MFAKNKVRLSLETPAGLREGKGIKNKDPDTHPREIHKLQHQETRRLVRKLQPYREVCLTCPWWRDPGAARSHAEKIMSPIWLATKELCLEKPRRTGVNHWNSSEALSLCVKRSVFSVEGECLHTIFTATSHDTDVQLQTGSSSALNLLHVLVLLSQAWSWSWPASFHFDHCAKHHKTALKDRNHLKLKCI